MIEFHVLGTIDLRDSSQRPIRAVLAQPRRLALLCFLAMAARGRPQRRDTLLALFWPESPEDRARNSLNQAVYHLRRSLGDAALETTPEEVGLSEGAVRCDAVAFEAALEAGDTQGALGLYAGELLPGFHLESAPDFGRWLDGERDRLRRRAVAAALAAADALEQAGNGVAAIDVLRRATEWAPWDETPAGRLIVLLARLGDRAGALHAWERFRERLAAELEAEPTAALLALVQEIRETPGVPAAPGPARTAASGPVGGPAPAVVGGASPMRAPPPEPPPLSASPARRRVAVVALLATLILGAVGVLRWGSGTAGVGNGGGPPPLDPQRVLVAAFDNRTGDSALDPLGWMAADWITGGIADAGLARTVPFSTVVQETPFLTPEPASGPGGAHRELARRVGAGVLVTGGYYRSDGQVVLQASVVDVASGELVRSVGEVWVEPHAAAGGLDALRRQTIGALATLFDARLESWPDAAGQPSSLEAYQLMAEGMDVFLRAMNHYHTPEGARLFAAAAERLEVALALDPAFTTAGLWAAYARINAGDNEAAARHVARLEGGPLTPWSRAVLDHLRAGLAGDQEGAYRAAREMAALSPDSEWLVKLADASYRTGRAEEALSAFLRVQPDHGWIKGWNGYWRLRVEVRHLLGQYTAALDDARRGLAAVPDDAWLHTQMLWNLAALGRADAVFERVADRATAGDPRALWQLATAVEELIGHGHRRPALRMLGRALPAIEAASASTPSARAQLGRLLELAGRDLEAEEAHRGALDLLPEGAGAGADSRIRLAMLALRRGHTAGADTTLAWLDALDGEALSQAIPAEQLPYWGSAEAWRHLSAARILAASGERDSAIGRIRRATTTGLAHGWLHLHDDPDFAPLRGHPAFEEMLRLRR